ncbi:MAG: hypothetical protein BMS9Abin37_0398 [Acidobacteriota bacterium]|nr:MAG: hypothetical protein BMS9Abin37_0398 [Acidobacteriota bacterium]
MSRSARYLTQVFLGLACVLVLAHAARHVAGLTNPALEFDVGPSTGSYLEGFTESEERVPVTFRWTRERADVALPLAGEGPDAVLQLRYARFLDGNATVRLFVDGEPQGVFSARSGRFRTLELPVKLRGGPTKITFLVDDPDPERLGIAIDWLRIENSRWRASATVLRPTVLLVGVFLLTLALGFSLPRAVGLTALVALFQTGWFACNPFAMVHVHEQLTVIGLSSAALIAAVSLMTRRARSLPLLFLLGYFLKGAVLFHPAYWYPDVRLHRRYVEILDIAQGSIVERGIEAQKGTGTAYPRRLGGRNYALPYSPLFYVPFTFLDRDARGLESSMKHVGLLLASVEVLLVYALASYLFGARVAFAASVLALFLPPLASRLLYAQWPTLAGHLLDVIAIGFAARLVKHPDDRPLLWGYGAGVLASFLSYISSLFNMSLFACCLALVERRRALQLILVVGSAGLLTISLLYLPFVRSFMTEIVPAVMSGAPSTRSDAIGFGAAIGRIPLFYGFGFPVFALGGLVLSRHNPAAFRTLGAYGATFVALLALRAVSGAFKDLKELVFIGPFIAITTGLSLEALAARGRTGRFAAIAVALGLIAFGLSKLGQYTTLHTKLAGLD